MKYHASDIYACLGVSSRELNRWDGYIPNNQRRICQRYHLIKRSALLFGLNHNEEEGMANKAGISLAGAEKIVKTDMMTDSHTRKLKTEVYGELFPYTNSQSAVYINSAFLLNFNALFIATQMKPSALCEAALVSERMFRHIRSGKHLAKEPIIALLIAMGLELQQIQTTLSKAGFILTPSLLGDVIIMWMLENALGNYPGTNRVALINEVLEAFHQPLLMTKQRS